MYGARRSMSVGNDIETVSVIGDTIVRKKRIVGLRDTNMNGVTPRPTLLKACIDMRPMGAATLARL